ncbi:RNA polymerase factor sigma-32 [Azospirillum sp. ST 5-10]|uniref:RNA polymerase factor sigma-32 n=1 Tax=unclassified Azospirillum TaxID=2630922 RepID=UPI003F4A85B7
MSRHTSEDALDRYLLEVRRCRALNVHEEQELARRWREGGDAAAFDRLVRSHLGYAVKVAKAYRRYGLPLADLVAEANLGLVVAARKFDPHRGLRFATVALWWMRAALKEYVLRNWSVVKVGTTDAQRKLFFNLRHLKARLQELENGDLTPASVTAVARTLGVTDAEVVEMNRRLAADRSLDVDADGEGGAWRDRLADERADPEARLAEAEEHRLNAHLLALGLAALTERDRQILVERRLREPPVTTEELGRRFRLTRQRVGQIETKALEALRTAVAAAARERPGPAEGCRPTRRGGAPGRPPAVGRPARRRRGRSPRPTRRGPPA